MMHYSKGRNVEEELTREKIPIDCLPEQFLWMHVKGGTKVSNVIEYAKKAIENGEYRSIVWSGSGGGVTKTISCAEILKRSYSLHQVTKLCQRKCEEYWEPQTEGLEEIIACRKIPCIHILLSLDAIDPNTPGYQHTDTKLKFDTSRPNPENKSRPNNFNNRSENRNNNQRSNKQFHRKNKNKKSTKDSNLSDATSAGNSNNFTEGKIDT